MVPKSGSTSFQTPKAGGKVDKDHPTQVGRALKQLGIRHIAAYSRFFDVSSGLEEVFQGCGDEIDHGRESCGVTVATGSCPCGLEQAVEAFEAGVAVGG